MPPTPTRITFAESKDRRPLPKPAFHDPKHHIRIYQADCLQILAALPADCVDLIFADPPYFLSNGGITCQNGRMVSVNKGAWDRSCQGRNVVAHRGAWIIHEQERNALEMRPNAVITFKATWAPFNTLLLSLNAPKWAETRVQTVFHAIDSQDS